MDNNSPRYNRKGGKPYSNRYAGGNRFNHEQGPEANPRFRKRPSPFEKYPTGPESFAEWPAKEQPQATAEPAAHSVVIIDQKKIDPFDLFCAFHLGISGDGAFRPQTPIEVARRFNMSMGQLNLRLHEFGMDPETIQKSGFDLRSARYDIKVAPPGISRRELARPWFEELQEMVAGHTSANRAAGDIAAAPLPAEIELKSPIFED